MGVDYAGVGGIGIRITEEDEQNVREFAAAIDPNLYEDNFGELLDHLLNQESSDAYYSEAGSAGYSGDPTWYLHVPGNTLDEILENSDAFLSDIRKIGLHKIRADLKVISDLHIY